MRLQVVLDWDGTVTKRDTLHIVAAIGYDHNRNRDIPPWDDIVQAYLSDYTDYESRYTPATKDRKTVAEESKWLASLKDTERGSIERVKSAGIFSGVTKEEVVSASKSAIHNQKLQLRPGWRELFSMASMNDQDIKSELPLFSIISVNWSSMFIRACLETALAETSTARTIDAIPVYANEVALGNGKDSFPMYTSADKLARFNILSAGYDGPVAYVGDSPTDFDCLIAADIGICVQDDLMGSGQKDLKEMLERVGFELLRLSPAAWETYGEGMSIARGGQGRGTERRIWWVPNLEEVARFVKNSR